jgi:hypothetical protein
MFKTVLASTDLETVGYKKNETFSVKNGQCSGTQKKLN